MIFTRQKQIEPGQSTFLVSERDKKSNELGNDQNYHVCIF